MKITMSKCLFLVNKLIFLGNIITPEGIGPDPEKLSDNDLFIPCQQTNNSREYNNTRRHRA